MASSWLSRKKRLALYHRDNYRCMYCSQYVVTCANRSLKTQHAFMRAFKNSMATIDHVIPKMDVLVLCCNACNSSKRKETLESFCTRKGYNSRAIKQKIRSIYV